MIIFDLEWNRSYDKIALEEILQIGAVRVEQLGGPIVDTFSVFIRPQVHKKLNRTAKGLPELRSSLDSKLDFAAAITAFADWCGDDLVFADWGGDDFDILRQNCAYWKLPCPRPERLIDLQAAFSLKLGISQGVALNRAVEYCGIPLTYTFHNALNDAMYTALLTDWISTESLSLLALPKEARRLLQTPEFPPQPIRQTGALPAISLLLNSRGARHQVCPVCGDTVWVRNWYDGGYGRYYADFRCRAHGSFLCRLTTSTTKLGLLQGQLAVPEITTELLEEFAAALQGKKIVCKGNKGRKKRRRRGFHRTPAKKGKA